MTDQTRRALVTTAWLLQGVFLLSALGCGQQGPALALVEGVVTLDGKAAPHALVQFNPQAQGAPAFGVTDIDGRYQLRYTRDRMGAAPGSYTVQISTEKLTKDAIETMTAQGMRVSDEFVKLPNRYRTGNELTATVDRGKNVIDFALTSAPP